MKLNNMKNKSKELKQEHLVFMSDDMYLPIHYKGMVVQQPFYQGDGVHSVKQLEAICNQYKEYVHQQAVVKQSVMKALVELKFDLDLLDDNLIFSIDNQEQLDSDIEDNEIERAFDGSCLLNRTFSPLNKVKLIKRKEQ